MNRGVDTVGNKKYRLIFLVLVCLFLSGCDCFGTLTIGGTVLDGAGKPLSGVEVFLVDVKDPEPRVDTTADAKTKDDGTYLIESPYAYRSNSYIIFKKTGYQDVSTKSTPFGDLDACKFRNVTIIRDVVMKP